MSVALSLSLLAWRLCNGRAGICEVDAVVMVQLTVFLSSTWETWTEFTVPAWFSPWLLGTFGERVSR